MANPQIENGYIKIANSVSWAFEKIRISGEEYQCLWVILNMTYGWNKKTRPISLNQFTVRTGIKKPNIIRALQKLINKNLIVIKKDNKKTVSYGLNKNYEIWKPLSKKITLSKMITNVIKKDNTKCSNDLTDNKLQPPKDIFKDNNTIYIKNLLEKINQLGKEKGLIKRDLTQITEIKARLNDGYTGDEILRACVNCFNSIWHIDTGKATDLEYILRKSKIDTHINMNIKTKKKKYDRDRYRCDSKYAKTIDNNRELYE